MSSFSSILEREPPVENILTETAVLNNSVQDLEETLIPKTPIDFVANANAKSDSNSDSDSSSKIQYREFQSDTNNYGDGKDNHTSVEAVYKEQKGVIVSDVGNNDRGGIVYDIIHILDDVYSYGRTVIENNYFNFANNDDFNLVYPNIYIGNYSTSTNLELLQNVGITHIISVIPTFNPPFPDKFKYLHIQAYDDQSQDLSQHFEKCNLFIKNMLKEGGKVLIHCMVGRSRSVTLFLGFLINIICGNFNQSVVNLFSDNDVSNEVEYKQFGKSRNKLNIKYNSSRTNTANDTANDNITTLEYIKPELSNKYLNFINYKKETMISEVDELIKKYKLFQKEIHILTADIVSDKSKEQSLEQSKEQFANNFITQILNYIKKYRSIASPNPYFITQLVDLLIQS
jgi:hypothetical protein